MKRIRQSNLGTRITSIFVAAILLAMIISFALFTAFYRNQTLQVANTVTLETINSLSANIYSYLENLSKVTLYPYINEDIMYNLKKRENPDGVLTAGEVYELDRNIRKEFSMYFDLTQEDVLDYMMIAKDGSLFYNFKNSVYVNSSFPFTEQDWYQEILAAEGNVVYIGSHTQDYVMYGKGEDVFSVGRLIKNIEDKEVVGVIFADAKINTLKRLLDNVSFQEYAVCVILDGKKNIVCTSRALTEEEGIYLSGVLNADERTDSRFCALDGNVSKTGWSVLVILDQRRILSGTHYLTGNVILLLLGGMACGFLFFHILSNKVIAPLYSLTATIKRIKEGELNVRYQVTTQDEIGELGQSFNEMLDRLLDVMEREKNSFALQKKAELSALQSQINPHFIYNVLNNFIGLNQAGEKELLEQAIQKFADLLRYMLRQSEMVPLFLEIEMLEKYSDLNKLRYGERLETVFSCDDDVKEVLIPKLLLQPLVENAIVHGIEPSAAGGYVSVVCETDEQFLTIVVEDNGIGFDNEFVHAESCIGLNNVKERLQLSYPGSKFMIKSKVREGTRVVIQIAKKELKYADIAGR